MYLLRFSLRSQQQRHLSLCQLLLLKRHMISQCCSVKANGLKHLRFCSVTISHMQPQLTIINPSHTLPPSSSESSSLVKDTSLYPLTKFIAETNFSPRHRAYMATIISVEPKHFKKAVQIFK